MLRYLADGWRDESSEGPYTEILQTKSHKLGERCTICKLYESPWLEVTFRDNERLFTSVASAKAYAEKILNISGKQNA